MDERYIYAKSAKETSVGKRECKPKSLKTS